MQKYVLLVLDWVVVNASLVLALVLDTGLSVEELIHRPDIAAPVLGFGLGYSLFVLSIFQSRGMYRLSVYLRIGPHTVQIVKSLLLAVIGMGIAAFLLDGSDAVDTRTLIIYFFHICLVSLLLLRVGILRSVFRFAAEHGWIKRKMLVVGSGPTARKLVDSLDRENPYGVVLAGFVTQEDQPTDANGGLPVLGSIADIERIVRNHRIKEIILALDDVNDEDFWGIAERCANTGALLLIAATDRFAVIPTRMHQEEYGDVSLFGVMNFTPYLGVTWLRRAVDLILAALGILLLLPVYIVVALAIKIDSRGGVIYAQQRIGKDGKPFSFYKFRSMVVGSDVDYSREEKLKDFISEGSKGDSNGNGAGNYNSTKIVDDSKVTRVGRFIRKTSIDELPQLFNVIRGDMSLIGPRPCLPYEWRHYEPWHKRRMAVKPGCTGLWQTLARSRVGFRDMVILDLFYVYNVSFHLDIWLLLRTIPVMLFSTGGK